LCFDVGRIALLAAGGRRPCDDKGGAEMERHNQLIADYAFDTTLRRGLERTRLKISRES
jgi:hypothetical protein